MASESSVAPKERVNIRYKPATGDAREDVELPHKLLMLADFTGRPDDTPVGERKRIDVNKDTFTEVMRNHNLTLAVKVPNKLSEDPDAGELSLNLKIGSMKDLEPEQVAAQVPELQQLMDLRQALMSLKGPVGNVPAFRKAIERILSDEGLRQKLIDELGVTTGEGTKE
jgi:type VI secretion system protein ImpB